MPEDRTTLKNALRRGGVWALWAWVAVGFVWIGSEGWRRWVPGNFPSDPVAWHAGDRKWSAPLWPMPSILHTGAKVEDVDRAPAFQLPSGAMLDWGRFAAGDDRMTLHFRVQLTPAVDPPEFFETYLASWMGPQHRGILKLRPEGLHWDLEAFVDGAWRASYGFDCGRAPLRRWSSVTLRAGNNSWDVWIDGTNVAAGMHWYSPPPRGSMVRFMGNIGTDRVTLAGDATYEGDIAASDRAAAVLRDKTRDLDVRLDDLILFDRRLTDAEVHTLGRLDRERACAVYARRMEPVQQWTLWGYVGVGACLLLLWVAVTHARWVTVVLVDRDFRVVQAALLLGGVLTVGLAWGLHRTAVRADEERFKEVHGLLEQVVYVSFESIALEVRRVADWVGFQSRLDPVEWTRWVEASSMLHEHSGLLGIGYAQQVPREEQRTHETDWAGRWGFPYSVWPREIPERSAGSATRFENAPRLPVVLYACQYPTAARWRTNGTVLGRDLLWVDPSWQRVVPEPRRIEDAVGHRGMTASGLERIAPKEWFDEPVHGLRLYQPCLNGTSEKTSEILPGAWQGVAFASVDLRRWYLSDVSSMNLPIGFRMYTGDPNGDRHDLVLDTGELARGTERPVSPRFEHTLEIKHYGSRLWIDCWTTEDFARQSRAHWPWVAGFGGGSFTLLTALALGFQVRARLRERSYARQLAEANAALAKVQRERERLSRDLHDGSIQSLYAVGLHLRSARRQVSAAEQELGTGLAECQRLVQTSILELRDFLLRLKEESGPTRTYREVMDEWVRRLRRISSEDIELVAVPGSDALPARVVIELVQITREAVSNAMRHAGADRIVVTLGPVATDEREWALEIQDDGSGWREEPASGVGFRSMRERAAEIGGRLEIRSQITDGTRVRVVFDMEVLRLGGTS